MTGTQNLNMESRMTTDLLDAPATPGTHTGELAVMGRDGDTKVLWDAENEAEVDAARATFDGLKEKGFAAFAVKRSGRKGDQIDEFDPNAEKIILVPQLQGG